MKYIVYARGQVFEQNKHLIQWTDVVAVIDKNACKNEYIEGVPVYHPDKISELYYEYVVIFSNKLYESIRSELIGRYLIPDHKIFNWKILLDSAPGYFIEFVSRYIKVEKIRTVLLDDVGFVDSYFLNKSFLSKDIDYFDIWNSCGTLLMDGFYDRENVQKDLIREEYDLAIITDKKNIENANFMRCFKRALIFLGFDSERNKKTEEIIRLLTPYGSVKTLCLDTQIVLEFQKRKRNINSDICFYIVSHKQYSFVKCFPYRPILVGGYHEEQLLSDDKGKNIAWLNEKINECTALYWIWKNTDTEYVGLCHYRRYLADNEFAFHNNYLMSETAVEWLEQYDIILNDLVLLPNQTIQDRIYDSVADHVLYQKGLELVYTNMKKYHPEDYSLFCEIMQGHSMYSYHIFVMRRGLLEQYCEWLFPMLIDSAEAIDVSKSDSKSRRVIGYFAECFLSVWVIKKKLKVKELPLIFRGV